MGLDSAPIEFQTFYFSHVCVTPPKADLHHKRVGQAEYRVYYSFCYKDSLTQHLDP